MSKRTVVPLLTAMTVPCTLDNPVGRDYLFTPSSTKHLNLFTEKNRTSQLHCSKVVINTSEKYVTFEKDEIVDCATEIEETYPIKESQSDKREAAKHILWTKVSDGSPFHEETDVKRDELPQYLQKTFKRIQDKSWWRTDKTIKGSSYRIKGRLFARWSRSWMLHWS